jgi:hypothetical protein
LRNDDGEPETGLGVMKTGVGMTGPADGGTSSLDASLLTAHLSTPLFLKLDANS